jgi:sulfate permease, SulP family
VPLQERGVGSVPWVSRVAQFSAGHLVVGTAVLVFVTERLADRERAVDKDRESRGQGIANVVTGFFGGMAGCAMIGQTMINVRVSGARTRISTFCAGAFLLVLVVGLGSVVAVIPMAALVAVMILVAVSTFDWHSIAPSTFGASRVGRL